MSGTLATDLLLWGLVVHLICDWPLQNDWMAANKTRRGWLFNDRAPWWDRHPAAYVHAGIHTLGMLLVFSPLAAVAIGVTHFLIDLRAPVAWWSKLVRQTQPGGLEVKAANQVPGAGAGPGFFPLYDVGLEVRFWTDQVAHIAVIAAVALIVGEGPAL